MIVKGADMNDFSQLGLDRERIAETDRLVDPYIRRTPGVEVQATDFGLDPSLRLFFKLELLQHAGSFKSRVPSRTC
jgi:threonine dehydratase